MGSALRRHGAQNPTRPLSSRDADHYASCGTHLCSLPCEGSSVIDSAWTGGIDGDSLVGDTHYNAHPRFGALGRGVYMGDILAPQVPNQADADPQGSGWRGHCAPNCGTWMYPIPWAAPCAATGRTQRVLYRGNAPGRDSAPSVVGRSTYRALPLRRVSNLQRSEST